MPNINKKFFIGLAIVLVYIALFFGFPQKSQYLTIEGTAPPGMLIEVETTFVTVISPSRGDSLGADKEERVVGSAYPDSNGKYSLRVEFLREKNIFPLIASKNYSYTRLYLSFPEEGLYKYANWSPKGIKAADILDSEDPNNISETLSCQPIELLGALSWDCQPPSPLNRKMTEIMDLGELRVYKNSESFTLNIQVPNKTVESRQPFFYPPRAW
ncbi:hypothetical protein [Desulfovibrio litoralis]|uniref:Uncharacterized protein n=1 Tax=Desulfovibrio litoralis DSM 11393 TaxID=1121455 RepID=A0A1M7SGI1_9BACT|nr:hypothetical protein [Desulfovibrio litoralis]SHN57574.1 hypothetical protein SAMN02745728_00921 [Desulfovibrio litoralis DSM 11393]